ncbi:MAG: cytochrome c-type biogenesis protein CcmH [Nitrospinae bacterium]|nr:cytochrome c-type biogenesis protein CcmH [Nitrospinota bacterium]
MIRFLLALCLVIVIYPHQAVQAASPGAKTTFSEVAGALMSPVCPGKLLHDCPSSEGAQLRELVRRKIFAGESKEQIVRYFVEVYGRDVLPKPPAEGFYLTAWLLPFGGLLAGFGVVFVLVRSWVRRPEEAEQNQASREVPRVATSDDSLENRLQRELGDFEG